MRVLQLISSNGFYGAEAVVMMLSTRLVELGCETTIGLFNASQMPDHGLLAAAKKNGVMVWDLVCDGPYDPWTVVRLVRFIRSAEVDVLHTHGYKANLYGLIAARLTGATVIATCHNWTDRTPALRRYGSLDKGLLRYFDSVVAVSDTVASNLDRGSFPKRKLRVIPNGIDIAKYRGGTAHAWNGRAPVLGAISRLSREKGIDILIRALPKLLKQHPDLLCVVVGEGPERESLLQLAEELGVTQNLLLSGFQADIPKFLASCSVVVHPARKEGMPLAILEAMAAGRPIVASAVGGIPTLLQDGLAGLLVPAEDPEALANGVLRFLEDAALRETLGSKAAQRALENFEAAGMARAYLDTYRQFLSPSTPLPMPLSHA